MGYWDMLKHYESTKWHVGRNWTFPPPKRAKPPRQWPWRLFSFVLLVIVLGLLIQAGPH